MADLIDRQAAIDATWYEPSYTDPLNVLTEVRDRLEALPSAQPEQSWIPCSDDSPKADGRYLITGKMGTVYSLDFEDGRWYGGIKPVAWMPLPEPYKGGEQDECNGNLYSNSDHVFFNRRACWGSSWQGRKEKIMDDLISRQAAIDAIHEDADWLAAQGSDWQEERMERDKSILMSLPSAQAERCEDCRNFNKARLLISQRTGRWIPVSERLPEDGVEVWVTIKGSDVIKVESGETIEQAIDRVNRIRWVTRAYWSEEEHGWNDPTFGCPLVVQPITWMPIEKPEPYEEVQE